MLYKILQNFKKLLDHILGIRHDSKKNFDFLSCNEYTYTLVWADLKFQSMAQVLIKSILLLVFRYSVCNLCKFKQKELFLDCI